MNLIADIGGTNARLAIAGPDGPLSETIRSFRNADFSGFEDLLDRYLAEFGTDQRARMVVAVAGPVSGNRAKLTNLAWELVATDLAARFRVGNVEIVNDLTALGHAALYLKPDQVRVLAEGPPPASTATQALVVGIGTGFNVSPVTTAGDRITCLSVEAGHASLPISVAQVLSRHLASAEDLFPTVEHCFSGRGLQRFLEVSLGRREIDAAATVAAYGRAGAEEATAAIDLYAEMLGLLLRDLALFYLPTRGIFLAGGVARSVLATQARDRCAAVFARPSRFYPDPIPVSVITEDAAALTGCARIAATPPG